MTWRYLVRTFTAASWPTQPGVSGLEVFLNKWGEQGWEAFSVTFDGSDAEIVFKQPAGG